MSIVNIEPLIHGELLATKLTIKLEDTEGNYSQDNVLNVLLNCGWSLDFDREKLELYNRKIEDVDVIIITDGDFSHAGAVPWLVSRFLADRIPDRFPRLLCTEGTYKFMRACFIDVLENVNFTKTFEYYSAEDLEFFNANSVKLRYRETYTYVKNLENVEMKTSFCAVNNGYSIGGALWEISAGFNTIVCGDKIRIYPSTLLNGININELVRPDLLLLSHEQVEVQHHLSGPQSVEVCNDLNTLVDRLVTTLNNGGNVLFPMDVDYTLVNLLIHLNMIWTTSHLSQFKIVLASPIADKLLLFIGTCLEYLKTNIFHNFIQTLWNPLMNLSKIEIITSLTHVSKYRFSPTVFISTTSNVDFGFSNFLFVAISSYYKNMVVLTRPNESVTKYIYDQKLHDGQPPQYKLQINLRNTRSESDEVDSDEKNGNKESTHYQEFGDLAGRGLYPNVHANATLNVDHDAKNTQDYGLPFDELLADPANPYGYITIPNYEEYEEEPVYTKYETEKTGVEDYYRKYVDDNKSKGFDMENEAVDEPHPKSEMLTKKFPFILKSQICMSNCFSNEVKQPQMASLLYRTSPRNIVLIPNKITSSKNEQYLNNLLKCKIHSFYNEQQTKNKTENKRVENKENMNEVVSVNLNITNHQVLLETQLLASVRSMLSKGGRVESKRRKNEKYQRINTVLDTIQQWKNKNNRNRTCQVISKLTSVEDVGQEGATPSKVMNCHTFWSEESTRRSKLEFKVEETESEKIKPEEVRVKMGLDQTLLIGEVSMATCASFMDDCLPNTISMESGSMVINQKVRVSKQENEGGKEWVVEGTLDPSYYLARKIVKRLHSRVEPIY
ncbi:hypothetical protein MACJ_001104 [Theileria orientalis]|uniref:Cleavage and polyadenylation specificity factor subunit 2 n=1 Tax=Theileria orientalis TaxID=68886 RepID=A0A976M7Y4_THEOR|nr:hypothetical protein MACJ_001104 [Theileria orientalis]